jgi:hypothetical protein
MCSTVRPRHFVWEPQPYCEARPTSARSIDVCAASSAPRKPSLPWLIGSLDWSIECLSMVSTTSTKALSTTSRETANNNSSSSEGRLHNSAYKSHRSRREPIKQEVSGESRYRNVAAAHGLQRMQGCVAYLPIQDLKTYAPTCGHKLKRPLRCRVWPRHILLLLTGWETEGLT